MIVACRIALMELAIVIFAVNTAMVFAWHARNQYKTNNFGFYICHRSSRTVVSEGTSSLCHRQSSQIMNRKQNHIRNFIANSARRRLRVFAHWVEVEYLSTETLTTNKTVMEPSIASRLFLHYFECSCLWSWDTNDWTDYATVSLHFS